jgi:hypothetical protein
MGYEAFVDEFMFQFACLWGKTLNRYLIQIKNLRKKRVRRMEIRLLSGDE